MTSAAFGKRRFSKRIEILYQRPLAGMGLVKNYAAGSNGYFDSHENVFFVIENDRIVVCGSAQLRNY